MTTDKEIIASLSRSEYLLAYDTFVEKFAKAAMYDLYDKDSAMAYADIIKRRKLAMVTSYYKYGSVRDNYIKHACMRPVEDIKIRANSYMKTHNSEALIDVINFAMLAYWVRSGGNYKEEEIDIFVSMFNDYDYGVEQAIILYADLYETQRDIEYLLLIGLTAIREIQHPLYSDAFYKDTDDEKQKIAGFCVNELRGE